MGIDLKRRFDPSSSPACDNIQDLYAMSTFSSSVMVWVCGIGNSYLRRVSDKVNRMPLQRNGDYSLIQSIPDQK
jgi:hypothetical protein